MRIRADLQTDSGAVARTVAEFRTAAAVSRRQGDSGVLFEMPLTGVDPSAYIVHVEATAADGPTVSRDVPAPRPLTTTTAGAGQRERVTEPVGRPRPRARL